jgi:hypothetical protein
MRVAHYEKKTFRAIVGHGGFRIMVDGILLNARTCISELSMRSRSDEELLTAVEEIFTQRVPAMILCLHVPLGGTRAGR